MEHPPPRAEESWYHVPNRKIIEVKTALESIQEEQDTPLVESHNQQRIYR